MFCKAALVTVALTLIASASPIKINGVRIPLGQRSTLQDADGIFDHDKAVIQTVMTMNKHRMNLMNLERNIGHYAFKVGAAIKPVANFPPGLVELLHLKHTKRQNEALTNLDDDTEWAGPVTIGTPAQKFFIDFDTGSADFWVPSSACNSTTCSHKSRYSLNSSSTSTEKEGQFSIQYGDGSTVSGPIFTDTVNVAGVEVKDQFFSPVTTLSDSFEDDPIDGILGLAYPALSNIGQNPFFNTAIEQGAVKASVFGFKLATNDSELYLGGTNEALYTGEIEYHPIDNSTGFWLLENADALVNGETAVSGFDTIIDSGTTIMYGPPRAVKAFYEAIEGSEVYDEDLGYYSYPCNSPPSTAFSWGGKPWNITASNFNLGRTEKGSNKCVGALAGQDIGLGSNVWLLGDSFMKNVYTAFSFEDDAVGFAELAEETEASSECCTEA